MKNRKREVRYEHTPNHISFRERLKCLVFSILILGYGTLGFAYDDLYVPGKRGPGMHFNGEACWIMYLAFLCAGANLLSVVVDHYDKRNNETNYALFARLTRQIGWILFILAIVVSILLDHS